MNVRLEAIKNWPELAERAHWNVAELADHCRVSVRTLERHFLSAFDLSPHDWMRKVRLEQSVTDLKNGASVKRAANKVGYPHAHHFSRDFKKHFGRAPSWFRRAPRL